MEFRSLHGEAVCSPEKAADNAMLIVPATAALRALFVELSLNFGDGLAGQAAAVMG